MMIQMIPERYAEASYYFGKYQGGTFALRVQVNFYFNFFLFLIFYNCNFFSFFKIRTRQFMELASASGRNILLTGPAGCGKTSLISDFLDKQGEHKKQCDVIKLFLVKRTKCDPR